MRALLKQLYRLDQKEKRFLKQQKKQSVLAQWQKKIEEKVPEKVHKALDTAFYQAFRLVFEKGTGIIEKTYDKEKLLTEHDVKSYAITRQKDKKSVRRLARPLTNKSILHSAATAAEGVGLGLLGIGLPDIPIFTAMLLKGLYEMALGYGFDYSSEQEKRYLLLLIRLALSEGEEKNKKNAEEERFFRDRQEGDLSQEMKETAKALSEAMLVAKFVQGMPLIGVLGGASNFVISSRVMQIAAIKYQKRYLVQELRKVNPE